MSTDPAKAPARAARGEKIKRMFKSAADALSAALYPEEITCDVCLAELNEPSRFRVCAKCLDALPFVGDDFCLSCGSPLVAEEEYCLRCQNAEFAFKLCRSPFEYDGLVVKMIHDLKFGGKKYIAETLGAFMADTFLKREMFAEIVCFVPMTREEETKRGFNQSELLACDVAGRLNLPMLPALVKNKNTSEQKALNARDRAANLEGAFGNVFKEVKRRSILLVDDIFTTGATSNECAKTLLKAGAREVSVLTAAITKQKIQFEQND